MSATAAPSLPTRFLEEIDIIDKYESAQLEQIIERLKLQTFRLQQHIQDNHQSIHHLRQLLQSQANVSLDVFT